MTMHADPHLPAGAPAFAGAAAAPRGGPRYRAGLKRAFDLLALAALAPLALPLVAVLAALVALDGGNPFFVQRRLGFGGRVFRMWKLRSMVPDAEAALAAHLARDPAARAQWETYQKLDDDPRVTRLGRLIRAASLDELPQLWNVLRGEMSFVGPRPMLPEQRALYPGHAYFRLRPGLTGPWQVSDRNAATFAARAEFDRAYDAGLSLRTDLAILAATVGVVLRATGK
jgi:lipopolysaccharide/colanic/teichoic acid biosynthesis glycosyltransferase